MGPYFSHVHISTDDTTYGNKKNYICNFRQLDM